jgi:hypothetical protein
VKVLVDTCVWSKVLRSDKPDALLSNSLRELILSDRVVMIGPILQEVLSGVRGKSAFVALKEHLLPFDQLVLTEDIYVKAAEYYNLCKTRGINGTHIDFLMCAAVIYYDHALWTTDTDFKRFEKHLPVKFFSGDKS